LEEREQKVNVLADTVGKTLPEDLMMCRKQVRMLVESGMEIGAHTINHPILTRIDDVTARAEIADSKMQLEEISRVPVLLFAYPNGKPGNDYEFRHVSMVKQAGFSAAVSTIQGVATAAGDLYQLPRFAPWDKTPPRFIFRLMQNYLGRPTQAILDPRGT
jgi:hypothetical protein